MNHIGQFFARLFSKAREYQDLARNRFNAGSTPKHEGGTYRTTTENEKVSRSTRKSVSSDQSNYSDCKTPAMFASAKRIAKRIVRSSVPKIVSSLKTPRGVRLRKEKLNTTFCVRKIDWDEISLEGDDGGGDDGKLECWSERRNNATWHLDQISMKSQWKMEDDCGESFSMIDKSRSPSSSLATPTTRTFLRTSSILDICKTDRSQLSYSPSISPGRTFEISHPTPVKRKLSVPMSLKNVLGFTEPSPESNNQNDAKDFSDDSWMSFDSTKLNPATHCPIFCSSKIDQFDQVSRIEQADRIDQVDGVDQVERVNHNKEIDRVDQVERIDQVDQTNRIDEDDQINPIDQIDRVDQYSDRKSISTHDSGFENRSSLVSNDTVVTNESMKIDLDKDDDDDDDGNDDDDKCVWKKGQTGISRWYSFTNSSIVFREPLPKDT